MVVECFDYISRRYRLQKRFFRQTVNYVKRIISVSVSIFSVPCELDTSNLAVFLNIRIFSACFGNRSGNILEEAHGSYVT